VFANDSIKSPCFCPVVEFITELIPDKPSEDVFEFAIILISAFEMALACSTPISLSASIFLIETRYF